MTRDIAIGKAYEIANMPNDDTVLKEFMDEIFDNQEYKICKNCENYREHPSSKGECLALYTVGIVEYYLEVDKDFYCKSFKPCMTEKIR